MKPRTLLLIVVLTVTAAACGAVSQAAGGDVRTAPPAPQPSTVPPSDLLPIDAALPGDTPDELVFKPVPVPVQPPSPKPVRSLPTPPPDRGVPALPEPHQPVIDAAVAHLASHLGVAPTDIGVLDARSVTWRDGSVGCPEEGLAYTQAEVPGYLVVLRVDDDSFRYHAAANWTPFLCDRTPQSPLEGSA